MVAVRHPKRSGTLGGPTRRVSMSVVHAPSLPGSVSGSR